MANHGLRRNLCDTYWRLIERYRRKPGGTEGHHVYPQWLSHDSEEVIFVSQSQHACLHYLIWMHEQTKESASAFIAVAVSWKRSKISPDDLHVVSYRLIEQVGAWSTREMKRPLNPDWQKAQYDHPQYEMRKVKGIKTVTQQLAEGTPAAAKRWVITNPLGETFEVYNLACVLRDLGLPDKTKLIRQGYTLEKQ
jgi:hypothetical protein